MKKVQISSRGWCVEVTGTQIDELRTMQISWHAYCQKRLTMAHDSAVQSFSK